MTEEQLAADRATAAELRAVMASLDRRFPVWAMATTPPKDITARSHQMKRDACLLYRNRDPRGDDPAHYRGLMRDADGTEFWVGLWVREVKGQRVLEIQRVRKTNSKKI
jgi:hypothetical protein